MNPELIVALQDTIRERVRRLEREYQMAAARVVRSPALADKRWANGAHSYSYREREAETLARWERAIEASALLDASLLDAQRLTKLQAFTQSLDTRTVIGLIAGHRGGTPLISIAGLDDADGDEYSEGGDLRAAIDALP